MSLHWHAMQLQRLCAEASPALAAEGYRCLCLALMDLPAPPLPTMQELLAEEQPGPRAPLLRPFAARKG